MDNDELTDTLLDMQANISELGDVLATAETIIYQFVHFVGSIDNHMEWMLKEAERENLNDARQWLRRYHGTK